MNSRPVHFSELINRLAPTSTAADHACGPLIGSAVEIPDQKRPETAPVWVILYGITESDVRLIHPLPLDGKKLAVQIAAKTGEILRIQLAAAASQKRGELYETTAAFLS